MTMHTSEPRAANAVAPRLDVESFSVVAAPELAAHPLVPPGICQNPTCSRAFAPRRAWQVYCCEACKRADMQEMRWVGLKAAPALLAWRMGKNRQAHDFQGNMVRTGPELRALSRAGQNYVTRLQTAWWNDRLARARALVGQV
jgi:hypothetical protein